jgi:hypothetical protein
MSLPRLHPETFSRLQRTPAEVEPKDHYQPTREYNPTMLAAKCALCKRVGLIEFRGGFNLREGDRIMEGRPIRGTCGICGKHTVLVPIKMTEDMRKNAWVQHGIDEALRYHQETGRAIPDDGIIMPKGRLEAYDKWRASPGGPAGPSNAGTIIVP